MAEAPVVLYHYDASPFANKIKNMLLVKGIPYKRVTVAMRLPRPEITDLLGVTYRRIPILAIGNDVYCDTNLISATLERRFPASAGYRSLYPPRAGGGKADAALAKLLVRYWTDAALFRLGADSLPYDKLDAKFIADREQFSGGKIDAKALAAKQGYRNSAIASHLALVEEQLADGRQWLLDTESIGALDVTAHLFLSWIRSFRHLKDIFSAEAFPKTLAWLDRVSKHLSDLEKSYAAVFEKLSGEDAAKLIASSPHEEEALVGFEAAEGARLGVKVGDTVSVVPIDSARVPTIGRLLALNREESVVEVKGQAGVVRCHFPRLEFLVKPAQTTAKL
ncbi:glutathione S-transferase family protein [Phanerochaete sordida]|uniref:Glutathione S-transferase family protein n=1 Tax=Phanerochaete sordida TaxID=48140 RepID=A0A9P3FZF7_9APHY|nr:glutathione S-transferase family protein [Phanerochaete sordida]